MRRGGLGVLCACIIVRSWSGVDGNVVVAVKHDVAVVACGHGCVLFGALPVC
jgi:hypothetical protein